MLPLQKSSFCYKLDICYITISKPPVAAASIIITKLIQRKRPSRYRNTPERAKKKASTEFFAPWKEKLTEYESRLHDRIAKRESTRHFLKQLTNKSLVTEFDKDLWNAVVDRVVVFSYNKVVFEFKDGTAVEQKVE